MYWGEENDSDRGMIQSQAALGPRRSDSDIVYIEFALVNKTIVYTVTAYRVAQKAANSESVHH